MYHLKISLGLTQQFHMVLEKEKNGQQIPYFTDDRLIFFSLNTLASTYRPHRPIQG